MAGSIRFQDRKIGSFSPAPGLPSSGVFPFLARPPPPCQDPGVGHYVLHEHIDPVIGVLVRFSPLPPFSFFPPLWSALPFPISILATYRPPFTFSFSFPPPPHLPLWISSGFSMSSFSEKALLCTPPFLSPLWVLCPRPKNSYVQFLLDSPPPPSLSHTRPFLCWNAPFLIDIQSYSPSASLSPNYSAANLFYLFLLF